MVKSIKKDFELGKRIACLRELKKLKQKEAAKEIGINYGTYQHYEYGNVPTREKLSLILKYYNCNKAWLLTGEGEPYQEDKSDIIRNQPAINYHNYEQGQAMKDLIEIFESGDSGSIQALTSVLTLCKQKLKGKSKFADKDHIRKEDRPDQRESLIKQRAI